MHFCVVLGFALSVAVATNTSLANDTVKLVAAPQLLLYGEGTCQPNRPHWELCGVDTFFTCQHACLSSDSCIGFDYDPAPDGCCRVRLISNEALRTNMPRGFTAIEGAEGDDFTGTAASISAVCYTRPSHKYNMLKYGNGNCAPNRPQRHGYLTFAACQQSCIDSEACIGFDYDPDQVYCRIRFHTNAEATATLGSVSGLTALPGEEGPGFTRTDVSSATCYVKPDRPFTNNYDFHVYGSGNCKPDRPQWEYCNGTDFQVCQQTCARIDDCIGFDYDAAMGGCCRIRFSSNDHVNSPLKPPEFKVFTGVEGPGFSGSSGPASATCYVKPNHPSSTTYDVLVYGPGNCQPERPQWILGNPVSFGTCQQRCLTTKDCMGFDYDPAFGGYCRVRFATNSAASLLTAAATNEGFTWVYGQEGYGFAGSSGQHAHEAATCYVKPNYPSSGTYDLFVYGPGNCQPERPQWKMGNPATFGICQQTCLQTTECMGFDYDPAFGGYCRIRFATNAEASLLTASATDAGFTADEGQEGYGFMSSSGQHSHEAGTCYVKPMFPGLAAKEMVMGASKSSWSVFFAVLAGVAMLVVVVLKIGKAPRRGSKITTPLLSTDS